MAPVLTSTPTTSCPKCGHGCEADASECPRCQIVFDKLARTEDRHSAALEESRELGEGFSMERLALVDRLLIRQEVERWEAFTGFEQANNYTVLDGLGNVLFLASEESSPWARLLLKDFRPFTMHVSTPQGRPVLTLKRPYRFFFHELQVLDARDRCLGFVKKRWSLVNRLYTLGDETSGQVYEIFGPFFRPWTFQIRRNGTESGVIRKKWSGTLREFFTDADVFGIEFPRKLDIRRKAVFLGAVFLIDFLHFEDNNRD